MSAVASNQNRAVAVSTCPLNGTAASTWSKALCRSVATISRRPSGKIVVVAHLAAERAGQARNVGFDQGDRQCGRDASAQIVAQRPDMPPPQSVRDRRLNRRRS